MVNKLKGLWEELMIMNEQVIWQNSEARRELARERIAALNRGENPYLDLMDE